MVAFHGRSVTLYEKAFPLSEQCSKKAHDQFLADLASILPSNTTPLIVSDAGFKVPWYKSVEKLGWYWLSRVRGKVQYADLGAENWKPISNLHDMSSSHSKTLGYKRLTKSNPISCQILLYKSRSKGIIMTGNKKTVVCKKGNLMKTKKLMMVALVSSALLQS